MQLKKNRSKNRYRPFMEQLETRLTPSFTGSMNFNPATGNLSVVGNDSTASFTATASASNTLALTDASGPIGTFSGVTGNVNISVGTTDSAAFTGTLALGGQTLLGTTNLSFSRVSTGSAALTNTITGGGSILGKTTLTAINGPAPGAPVNVTVSGAVVSLVGGLAVNTSGTGITAANADTVTLNPSTGSVFGPTTVTEAGNEGAINKLLDIGTAGGVTINGELAVQGVDSAVVGTTGTIFVNGNVNISTRNNTVGGSVIDLGATFSSTGNVSTKFGNNGTTAAPDVATEDGAIFGGLFTTLGNGTNSLLANTATTFIGGIVDISGNNGTNTVDLSNSSVAGSAIVFTAGNGNNTLTTTGISAGNARLTVSFGNGTNLVAFGANSTLLSATLIGGFGSNTFTGTVNFQFHTYNFS